MSNHRTIGSTCPGCGKLLDGAKNPNGDDGPGVGDLTVCCYCAAISVFDDDMQLHHVSAKELAMLPEEIRAQVAQAVHIIHQLQGRRH